MKRKLNEHSTELGLQENSQDSLPPEHNHGGNRSDKRFALPSADEQDHLRKTKNLFKSNLLQLEIDELLNQYRVCHSSDSERKGYIETKKSMRDFLFSTKGFLESLKPAADVTPESLGGVPCLSGWNDKDLKLDFLPPTNIAVVGSFMLDTMIKARRVVDLAVTMPCECFKAKDYLNHRYSDKRLLYLTFLAQKLKEHKDLFDKVTFSGLFGDTSKPVLVIQPAEKLKSAINKYSVRILPVIEDEVFTAVRLRPKQNNVRPLNNYFEVKHKEEQQSESQTHQPSPHYNMSIIEDIGSSSFEQQLIILHEVSKQSKSFVPTCVLLKVWCRVHGVSKETNPDTFHEGLLVFLLAFLIMNHKISPELSIQQMFRSILSYVSKASDHLFLRIRSTSKGLPQIHPGFEDEAFKNAFVVTLVGSCGKLNLAWRVSLGGWRAVKAEAKLSYDALEENELNGGRGVFSAVFMGKINTWQRYDEFVGVQVPKDLANITTSLPALSQKEKNDKSLIGQLCDYPCELFLRRRLEQIFTTAFVDSGRVTDIRIVSRADHAKSWPVQSFPERLSLLVCMQLDVTKAFSIIDKGPSAEDKDAATKFRAFWGDRSELRRFKDGLILETLDWTATKPEEVCQVISQHILNTQWPFNNSKSADSAPKKKKQKMATISHTLVGRELSQALINLDEEHYIRSRTVSHLGAFRTVRAAFERLSKRLVGLDLPLAIKDVKAADPALRYASAVNPNPHPLAFGRDDPERLKLLASLESSSSNSWISDSKADVKSRRSITRVSRFMDAINVVVQLESSSQWPDDIEAIRQMKTAFYVQIAEQFEADSKSGSLQRCIPARSCVDVLYEGFAFRLVLCIDKEYFLMVSSQKSFMGSVSRVVANQLQHNNNIVAASGLEDKQSHESKKKIQKEAVELERLTKRKPLLHLQLHALHTSSDATGGAHTMEPVTRLAKLWISGHSLWPHLCEEAIELIVSCVFLHPQPYQSPRSVSTGFLRFLSLLARWDWLNEPLMVGVGDGFKSSMITKLRDTFISQRDRASGSHMFVITPDDCVDENTTEWKPYWTDRQKPSLTALSHIVTLAKDSLLLLDNLLSLQASGDYDAVEMHSLWLAIFHSAPDQAKFDVVLYLSPEALRQDGANCRLNGATAKLYKNLSSEETVYIGVNPIASLVSELSSAFGHFFEFYFDPFRGDFIGLRWKNGVRNPVPLRVAVAGYAMPVKNEDKEKTNLLVVPNLAEILADIVHMGSGLVEECKIMKDK